MLKIHVVGCGSAFTSQAYYQTMFLLEAPSGKRMLFDCGSDARFALADFGVNNGNLPDMIDAVYISHLHGDHVGGLEWLGFCNYFNPRRFRPKLFANRRLMLDLWEKCLRGGMESVEGKVNYLTDYFDTKPVEGNDKFEWEGMEFTPVQTVHVMNGMEITPSYGLLVAPIAHPAEGIVVRGMAPRFFLTSDTQFCPNQIQKFYDMTETDGVIMHDCETAPYYSRVHAHFDDLKRLPAATKAKMWLCHYQPDPKQDAVAEGFRGFAVRKQVIEV
jgi:phosphoribosyl 1,2-cyclic phosphodiesterase